MKIVGTGIDLVETARLAESIARHGERFLARIYTDGERQYCASMREPGPYYAARFAAKEAVAKAFGTGIGAQLGWLEIDVRRKASGAPFIVLQGAGAETARRLGVAELWLTMSHTEQYAVAQVLAVGEE